MSIPTPTASAPVRAPRTGVNTALWVLQVVTAAVFVLAATSKLVPDPATADAFAAMGIEPGPMAAIAILEIAGAIALLVRRLAGIAGLAFVALLAGAVTITALTIGAAPAATPAFLLILPATIAWGRRRDMIDQIGRARRWLRTSVRSSPARRG